MIINVCKIDVITTGAFTTVYYGEKKTKPRLTSNKNENQNKIMYFKSIILSFTQPPTQSISKIIIL